MPGDGEVRAMKVKLPTFECLRCGHRWHPKKEEVPICCGFCKSPRWNEPPREKSTSKEKHEIGCASCRQLDN